MFRSSSVLTRLSSKFPLAEIELVQGEGYWYFTYTRRGPGGEVKVYETESVYTMRLNDMPRERWVETGQAFIDRMEQEA